jgi:DNA-binding response OmpR family regulator
MQHKLRIWLAAPEFAQNSTTIPCHIGTRKEFKTLEFLTKNAQRVISRNELLEKVWGYENYPCTWTVDNHMLRLRQKLEKDPSNPSHLLTVHGLGYKFVPSA